MYNTIFCVVLFLKLIILYHSSVIPIDIYNIFVNSWQCHLLVGILTHYDIVPSNHLVFDCWCNGRQFKLLKFSYRNNMVQTAHYKKPIFQELISRVLLEIETSGQVFCIALGLVTICIAIQTIGLLYIFYNTGWHFKRLKSFSA